MDELDVLQKNKKMKIAILFLFAGTVAIGCAAETSDKLLPDAPTGFLHFAINTTKHGTNEFYLKTDKILAVRIASTEKEGIASSDVEIYTVGPGSEYSPQGDGRFIPSNQRFLLHFASVDEAKKAVTSILKAITKEAEQDAPSNR